MPKPTFPRLSDELMRQRLEPPSGPVQMVLDTDTYNEIDDQFAVVYSLLSKNLDVLAFYAAPYFNSRSSGPADGMEKSYEEILRLLGKMGRDPKGLAFRGADRYLPDGEHPVESEAVADLIAKAKAPRKGPLYVLAVGAITNVASALLLAPELVERIVVVWLGGNPTYWPVNNEFNLRQDVPASQLIFSSGVPFVHIPCKNVTEHLRTTLPEMATYVKGKGAIGDYLYEIYKGYFTDHYARSKVIWDISTVAWLNNAAWLPSEVVRAPILHADKSWTPGGPERHLMRAVTDVNRDKVFGDLFEKLAEQA